MLYCHKTIYFIITLLTAHISIVLAGDNDSISPTNACATSQHANPLARRQRRNSLLCSYPKKTQAKALLYTFSDEEIQTSLIQTMSRLTAMRTLHRSNNEVLKAIKLEEISLTKKYQEVIEYRSFTYDRLAKLEHTVDSFRLYFDTFDHDTQSSYEFLHKMKQNA